MLPIVESKRPSLPANHILNWDKAAIQTWLQERGYPAFRAKQIWKWIFEGRADSFEDMTDLPKKLRQELSESLLLWTSTVVDHLESEDGTEKRCV